MQRQLLKTPKALKAPRRAAEEKAALKTASNSAKLKSKFDAFGSYTGVDIYDKYEKPVQDADDL
ncbi:MAG: hypothetical protein SPL13_00865 [Clostridia bacterium]|nr:hypothetical protein [Clostridia bacterium]